MRKPKVIISLAIGALALVNVALVAAIYARSTEPVAYAQVGSRPDVIAVSAHYNNGGFPAPIVMLDTESGQLLLVRPNISGSAMVPVDARNCAADISAASK